MARSISVPNIDEDERFQIPLFLPHVTMQPATRIALIGYRYTPVKTEGVYGYCEYFQTRWKEGKTFLNIEQDIVVWPGAIQALWTCPRPWCGYDFHLPNHQMRNLEEEKVGVPIGCVKITAEAIQKTPHLWDPLVEWVMCEQRITTHFLDAGLAFHQHHPGVVNANPVLLTEQNLS